ncbi:MAG: S8 family peptidase, partial [Actinomycetota bacterium]
MLVRFDPGTGARARDRIRDRADVRLERRLPLPRLELVKTRSGQTVGDAIGELDARPRVAYAEPNYIQRVTQTTPTDTDYGQLWGLNNTGQVIDPPGPSPPISGTSDADIDAPEAWDSFTGDSNVTVAVLDTGLAYDRSDIAPNVWTNPGETPSNGLDDDMNGFIDDVRGWDFAYDDNDPRDGNDHGTHVAGTIGAVGNNALDVVGVNWTVMIMPVQVCTHVGSCPVSDQIAGIDYANDMGAHVANMSIGGPGESLAQRDAIEDATGTIFAVAAGNEATNNDTTPSYPCNHPVTNLICVAASTQNDGLASFSNFGATS